MRSSPQPQPHYKDKPRTAGGWYLWHSSTLLITIWIEKGIILNALRCEGIGWYGTVTREIIIFFVLFWDRTCYSQIRRACLPSRTRNRLHRRVQIIVLYVEDTEGWEKMNNMKMDMKHSRSSKWHKMAIVDVAHVTSYYNLHVIHIVTYKYEGTKSSISQNTES